MRRIRLTFVILLATMLCPLAANAAFISLTPQGPVDAVNDGDVLIFDVVMDFTDYANGTLGGGFDIIFDSSALQFVSFFRDPDIGDPDFSRDPDILDGLLESWAVSDFFGLASFNILGSVTFQVLPTMGISTLVGTQATDGIGGPWVDGADFISEVPVEYSLVPVTRVSVPEPGTLMLLGLGLAGLGIARRRQIESRLRA